MTNVWNRFRTGCVLVLVCWVSAGLMAQDPRSLADRLSGESVEQLARDAERFGDPRRGAIAFYKPEMNCARCHEPGETLRRLGPNLAERRDVTSEHLVRSILNPSAEIKAGYETAVVQMVDGQLLSGVLMLETSEELILDQIEQPEKPLRLPLDEVEDWRRTTESSMPEKLANQLGDRAEFLDLVAYLLEVARGGAPRAASLRPASALVMTPLPEYEQRVDHAGLIRRLNGDAIRRGEELYRLRCESCHGTAEAEGSMPTSLRFVSGQFKRGSDPYSMYLTLTHGYGMMNPQRWMVPRQKYDVIHYIRESLVRPHNPGQYEPVSEDYLAGLPTGDTLGPKPVLSQPWTQMDYGPSLNNTIEVTDDGSNIAYKGIAVRLDPGPGGVESGRHWIMYDHDTMRVAGAWNGSFIDYNGIHFNGVHNRHPRIAGPVAFQNPPGPGFGEPGTESFVDNRLIGRDGKRYGPLARSWLQFEGLYRYGPQTVLAYRVGDTKILESPRLEYAGEEPVYVRTLQLGPRSQPVVIQIARQSDATWSVAGSASEQTLLLPAPSESPQISSPSATFDGKTFWQVDNAAFDPESDFTIVAEIRTLENGTLWARTRDQSEWMPNGQAWFLRGGRLTFDIGWVGAVQGRRQVDDGAWHRVAVRWTAASGRLDLFVDGTPDGPGGTLRPQPDRPLEEGVTRIGFANENFPDPSFFDGEIRSLTFYQQALADNVLAGATEPEGGEILYPPNETAKVDEKGALTWEPRSSAGPPSAEFAGLVGQVTPAGAADWEWVEGNLRLTIPAGTDPLRLDVRLAEVGPAGVAPIVEELGRGPVPDLEPLTRGGPPNWPQRLETEWVTDAASGPFAVDVLRRPTDNPWGDRLRLTGVDFLPNGTDAIVSTWDGSIWKVRGMSGNGAESPDRAEWQRIAAGLFQPLGVKIVDGEIFVTCRDQLVRLHDLNGDDEIDWYENFNSDHQVTEHFHEFAMGLQVDDEGNFYYAKSARHALPALVPHHGTLLKVSADGATTEILANGFRAANGVCLNPDGSFVVTDQEGHWNPKNRINWVEPGGFYGNMLGYHEVTDESDDAMVPPLCWITNSFDRSPAELVWVDSPQWGPLNGSLLNFSYGYGKVYIVPHEKVAGQMQGGMCEFPIAQFPTGVMRGRFHPLDGQLYCCGMFAWSGTQQQPGGMYRVRYTGAPVYLPIGLHAKKKGLQIEVSGELDPDSVADPENYLIQVWDLKRTKNYGSDHYNERPWAVTAARLADDGRTIELTIPEMAPTWCMEIVVAVESKGGEPVRFKIHNTVHALGDE